nr:ribonuclease H-like domain-containing protein [Tanacetum cinerariifolium]
MKEKISSKKVVLTKADESSSVLPLEITSDSESECDSREPLSPLPKVIEAAPSGTSESLISLFDLTLNMADLTLDTPVPKKTRPSVKVSHAYVIKKKTDKSHAIPKPRSDKKVDSSIEQLLLTLMEEPKCSTRGSTDHLTKEHLEHAPVKKTLSKLKAQSPLKPSPKKALMIPKPFKECKYYGFNDHHSDHYEFYPGMMYMVVLHMNHLIVLRNTPTSRDQVFPTGNHISQKKLICVKLSVQDYLKRSIWYLDSGCSRHMTWIKQYLHIYSKKSGPKVVFRDDSSGDTEGYGSVNCNGITFTMFAYVNGLKHNLISITSEKEKHHRASFKTKRSFSINKSLHLLHMDLFGPLKPQTITYNKYTLVIINEYSRDHLGMFDEKADDGFFIGYSSVAKAFMVFNIRRQETEKKTIHVTFSEDDEAISPSSTEGDAINFNENRSFPDDEFLEPMSEVTNCPDNADDVQPSPTIPPSAKVILQTLIPQDMWSREKHIELVNIICEPLAGITTKSRIRDSDAASASECLYVNFLSKMKPNKVIEALEEEGGGVCSQPHGSERSEFPNHVCKLDKALHEIKQAPRAWYKTLLKFLIQHKFVRGLDESGVSTNEMLFRGMIGSLMYLTASRPDIQFSTCICARYQANPKESHLVAVKRIFRDHILKGDIELNFIPTDLQMADIFTKPLAEPSFTRLVVELESTSSQQSQQLPPSSKVKFRCEDGITTFNNVVALLEHPNELYRPMISFHSNCCINKALTLQPSAMYVKYHKKFWYTAKVEEETKTIPSYFHGGKNPYPLLKMSSYLPLAYPLKKFPLLVRKVPPAEEKRCHCCEYCTAIEDKEMEHSNTTPAKIPILDTGKSEQWKFRIQQYLQNEHYALWEVIYFGDSYEVPKESAATGSASDGKKRRTVAITTEDIQKRRNDVKARTTLLNEATRKTKKNLLKQQYGNFKAEGKETLEQTFNRLHAIRNRSDLDTMSLDDLYNHLKVYELEVQKKSDSQNMAFISSSKNSSVNKEDNAASVPTASTQVSAAGPTVAPANISLDTACAYIASQSNGSQIKYEDINQIDEDDIEEMDIKWNMVLLNMRAERFWKKTGKRISIQGTNVAGFDKSKVECFNCHKIGHFARECRAPSSQDRGRRDNYRQWSKVEEQAPKALMAIDGVGWDWSYMANDEENHALVADEEAPIEFALMAKTSTDNEVFDNSLCSKACKKNNDSLNSQIIELNEMLATKDLDNLIRSQRSDKIKEGIRYSTAPPPAQVYSPSKKDMSWTGHPEFADDIITDYTRPSPSVESSQNDLQNSSSSASENGESTGSILSKPEIKFVKPANSPTFVKTGYVSFGQGGCKITGKGTIKTVVVVGTNSTNFSTTKEAAGQNVKKDVSSLRYIVLPNWFHEAHLETSTSNAQDACNADAPESSRNLNPTATSTNPPADHIETLAVETPIPTVSSPVLTACLNDSPKPSSDTRLISKRVTNQDDMPSLENILTLTYRFEDILGVTTNIDDTNGVEADLGNIKDNISASPIPTPRIYKDHPKSQIISPVDTQVQTRTKSKEMEEQSFIATIHQKTNLALL